MEGLAEKWSVGCLCSPLQVLEGLGLFSATWEPLWSLSRR